MAEFFTYLIVGLFLLLMAGVGLIALILLGGALLYPFAWMAEVFRNVKSDKS